MADVSVGMLLIRLAISLAVVVALMLIAARVLRRSGLGMTPGRAAAPKVTPIDVSAIKPVTRNASVAVVRVAGRELILGVTEQQVTLLRDAIEPRDAIGVDLDAPRGGDREVLDDASSVHAISTTAPARQRMDRAAANRTGHRPGGARTGSSAWTDALESLRERTVRR